MRSGRKTKHGEPGHDRPRKCELCHKVYRRKRFKSGRLESTTAYRKRRFCSTACSDEALSKQFARARWKRLGVPPAPRTNHWKPVEMNAVEFERLLVYFELVGENTTTGMGETFNDMFYRHARGRVTRAQRKALAKAFRAGKTPSQIRAINRKKIPEPLDSFQKVI